MFRLHEDELFTQQWVDYAIAYRDSAGTTIAERFILAVDEALTFIRHNPYACSLYDPGEDYSDLRVYQYRKWNLRGFPHAVIFRVADDATIVLEVLYAHKMNMGYRLAADTADDHTH